MSNLQFMKTETLLSPPPKQYKMVISHFTN